MTLIAFIACFADPGNTFINFATKFHFDVIRLKSISLLTPMHPGPAYPPPLPPLFSKQIFFLN